jgi:hypothetical protein
MKRYTDATLTADVRKSRRRGSFVTRGEFDPGALGVAQSFVVEREPFVVGWRARHRG